MKKLSGLNTSKKLFALICAAIFGLMAALNFLTPKCVDDYSYMISLATIERINGLGDIFDSLYVHSYTMNGRLVAHFFVYFFDWLPKPIFNFLNAYMFVLLLWLMDRMSRNKECRRNNVLFLIIFFSVWIFELAFGQVNLWLTGACNYLWSLVFALLFLLPYKELFIEGTEIKSRIGRTGFVAFSFLAGAYNEVASFAAVFIAILFLGLLRLKEKQKVAAFYCIPILSAVCGYLSMFLSRAESAKSGSSFSITALWSSFLSALKMYISFWPLLVSFVVLLILTGNKKTKLFSMAVIFSLGSLVSNFMLTAASSYPERCAAAPLILLIIANSVLLRLNIQNGREKTGTVILLCLLPFMAYNMLTGIYDIYRTGRDMRSNVSVIIQSKERGDKDIVLKNVIPSTKYSPIYGLKYIDCERTDTWPNENMATYYEVDSIAGIG